jgi:outer membrane lipoprotein SlyB
MLRFARTAAVLAFALGVVDCGPRNAAHPAPEASIGPGIGLGTIVAVRPAAAPTLAADGINPRASIISAIGGAGSAAADPPDPAPAVEFIVHEDSGQTISVVQTNGLNLQPGERVAITGGAHARLARAVPPLPGS